MGSFSLFHLLIFLAIIGFLITSLVWFCTDGTPGPNRFGPDPKDR